MFRRAPTDSSLGISPLLERFLELTKGMRAFYITTFYINMISLSMDLLKSAVTKLLFVPDIKYLQINTGIVFSSVSFGVFLLVKFMFL